MNNKIKILLFILSIICIPVFAFNVEISQSACKYAIDVPEGWDTIPKDVLKAKLGLLNLDLGIYPASQEDYFDGNYVLIGFMPTVNSLNKFTFEQITSDIEKMNSQGEIKNDTIKIQVVKIMPSITENFIKSYFSIVKDTVSLESCNTLYLTKFGYISVLSYQKSDGLILLEDINKEMSGIIKIQQDYMYSAPLKKNISIKKIVISLSIGLLVYVVIVYFPRLKRRTK